MTILRGNNRAVNAPSQPSLLPRRIAASLVDLGREVGLYPRGRAHDNTMD